MDRTPGPVTFTLDLEDHRPDEHAPVRFPEMTRRLLDHLAAAGTTGTFFVVGSVAEAQPDLVRDIASHGHEVALHGWHHTPLVEHDPDTLLADITRGKAFLEDLVGEAVVGYRAPTFSLISSTTWATQVLTDAGFLYSSSVLPTRNPLYGFPGAPRDPFVWPSGLVEFPVPIASLGRFGLPYLGGTYLRLLPGPFIASVTRRAGRVVPWTYVHPYDIDRDEPYWRVPDAGRLSPLLWVGRGSTISKLDRVLAGRTTGGGPVARAEPNVQVGAGGAEGPEPRRPAGTIPAGPRPGPPLRDRLGEARPGGTFHPAAASGVPGPRTATNQGAPASMDEFTQGTMVHVLPRAPLVDRIEYLASLAERHSVVHVGFVDTGCRSMQEQAGAWLHAHLAGVSTSLVGIDIDIDGVAEASAAGYEVYCADCRDADALAELGIEPATLVIAGEVIEHLDDPGAFLEGLHPLVAPGGRLVVTTPNAYGLFNVAASLARREINHPDHVVMFTWRTLTALAARHGWEAVETRVYVPSVKDVAGSGAAARILGSAARVVVSIERGLARLGRSYAADGLIVVLRSTR